MWHTGGLPALHRVTIVKLLTPHAVKGDTWVPTSGSPPCWRWGYLSLKTGSKWAAIFSPGLISIRLAACRTSIPRKRRGNHKEQTGKCKDLFCVVPSRLEASFFSEKDEINKLIDSGKDYSFQ